MREEAGIFEDKLTGFLRCRFTEFRRKGKRSPTYNLCTLDHLNNDPKTGRKRSPSQRNKVMSDLYQKKFEEKEQSFNELKDEKVVLSESDKHTVAEAIHKYMDDILPSRSVSTRKNFSQQLEYWENKFGDLVLSELTPLDIKNARDELSSPERSATTLNRYLGAFSAVLGCAVKDFLWLDENPCCKIRKLAEPRSRIRFLTLDEKDDLLAECDGDLYDAVQLALLTGARKQEIWRMRFDQINWKHKFLSFYETKTGIPRSVPMSPQIHSILQSRAKSNELRSKYVFPSPMKVNSPNSFEKSWENALRRSGVKDFRWHDLRHTSASYMVMAGISLRTVADILGHANISMTFKYAHLSPLHLSSALDVLDEELFSESKGKVKKLG